ncbi:protein sprouty isoform X2 [Anthonomus grandis grandis]|nr:protein sprouty isoform X2 [Anthonomus grandis grandis]XP_050303007.1 protein sprouty isoform X2 [Anthonomus grandis grandis]
MDGNGFLSAPQRGPTNGPVPITIPLTVLRPSPVPPPAPVTLTVPRPDAERRDNEYVETPLRSGQSPCGQSPLSSLSIHRPAAPVPPQGAICKQPVSFSKTSKTPPCGSSRPSVMCTTCGQCKCETCRAPKGLPQCWSCNGGCLLSADSVVDYASCLCCVKGLFYHCSEADDVDGSCADDPCGCGPDRRTARWGCLAALACVLPCLMLYWPLRGAKRAVELCYERHSRAGCRCRPPKQSPRPPAKRLLGNDSLQDF